MDWKEIKVLWDKWIYVATIWLMSLSEDDKFICNHRYQGLKGNQDIVSQMSICQVSMIEMKQKYYGLKWNQIIVIDIWILYDCVWVKKNWISYELLMKLVLLLIFLYIRTILIAYPCICLFVYELWWLYYAYEQIFVQVHERDLEKNIGWWFFLFSSFVNRWVYTYIKWINKIYIHFLVLHSLDKYSKSIIYVEVMKLRFVG